MPNKRILAALLTIFSFTAVVFADAAPEPGYTRIGVPLIVSPQDDFSGYRFFLDSPGGFEEIKLVKGKTTTISTAGRAGSMRFTELIAVPLASLAGYGGADKFEALQQAIGENKIDGVIKLISHSFDEYIKIREKKKWKNPVYVLKANPDKKIEAVETRPGGKTKAEIEGEENGPHLAINIAAGSLLSLSFIFGGVWLIRRKRSV